MNTKRRSLRGQVAPGEVQRLIVDDGNYKHGFKVIEFHVFGPNLAGNRDPTMSLGLDYDVTSNWDARDNRQIAWAGMVCSTGNSGGALDTFSLVDPNHIVVTDLYVNNWSTDIGNYLVVIEPIMLTEEQGIMALIKERSQDDIR